MAAAYCIDCTKILKPTERYYYEYRCEDCESFWNERIDEWLAGADDPELEVLYGGDDIS